MVQSSVFLLIVCKYYIVTSNMGSYLYCIETVLVCTGMFTLPCHPPPTKYYGFSGLDIPSSLTKINCWFCHLLYFFIRIKIKIELIKNNCYYCPLNLTCLLTMSHSYFSKCCMIRTIEAWTKVLAIKCMSFYKNRLDIIIWLFNHFEMTNTYLDSTQ